MQLQKRDLILIMDCIDKMMQSMIYDHPTKVVDFGLTADKLHARKEELKHELDNDWKAKPTAKGGAI